MLEDHVQDFIENDLEDYFECNVQDNDQDECVDYGFMWHTFCKRRICLYL